MYVSKGLCIQTPSWGEMCYTPSSIPTSYCEECFLSQWRSEDTHCKLNKKLSTKSQEGDPARNNNKLTNTTEFLTHGFTLLHAAN